MVIELLIFQNYLSATFWILQSTSTRWYRRWANIQCMHTQAVPLTDPHDIDSAGEL